MIEATMYSDIGPGGSLNLSRLKVVNVPLYSTP